MTVPQEIWKPGENSGLRTPSGPDDFRASVLARAIMHVETEGLSLNISAELIEGLAADAGVGPKQFARIWPTHGAFLADLFCELANQARIDRADTQTLLSTWQYLSSRVDDLHTAEGRRKVLTDLVRTVAEYNFEVVTASNKWRTYAALSTTITSWPDGEARSRILDALQASELSFVDTMESFYRNLMPTTGYRLKPEFNNDYQPFVVAAASVIEGLGIVRATVPALVGAHFDLPGEVEPEPWSVASLSFMGVIDAFFELNPEFVPEEAVARLSGGMDVTPRTRSDSDL